LLPLLDDVPASPASRRRASARPALAPKCNLYLFTGPNGEMTQEERMSRRLQERLDAAEETLRALRNGEVDAIVASGPDGECVYTLKGADEAYRLMVQKMAEGAATVALDGLILFSNEKLASILTIPHERVIGASIYDFIVPADAEILSELLAHELETGVKREVLLKAPGGAPVPVSLAVNRLALDGIDCFCVIIADLTDQKRNEEALHTLSARLLQIQDEDRRNIAHGLHDGAFQRLAALEFKLALIGQSSAGLPQAAQQNLAECRELVDKCCNDLSELAYLIQPPLLEEQGLGPALRAFVAGYNRRLGPQISLCYPSRLGRLPAAVETTFFRIIQEALANIEHHSGSETAEIHFLKKPGEILLEITDHGCGISREILKQLNKGIVLSGIGIAGLRERVRLLGGFMEICSGADGTSMIVRLPIRCARIGRQSA
jgi:PAS domain S-box-containing protein